MARGKMRKILVRVNWETREGSGKWKRFESSETTKLLCEYYN
jgi:hypothetical protein